MFLKENFGYMNVKFQMFIKNAIKITNLFHIYTNCVRFVLFTADLSDGCIVVKNVSSQPHVDPSSKSCKAIKR